MTDGSPLPPPTTGPASTAADGSATRSLFAFAGRDLVSSVVVFFVALPLCMGIAIAAGVPPALGLVSGIIGGIVVGVLAGSPLQVSGPAAGLVVLVWKLVENHGLAALGIAVAAAGLLQIVAAVLRLGQWFRAVSPAVVEGMLAGIGVLILASQFHVMVDDKPEASGLQNLASIPSSVVKGVVPVDGSPHHVAAAIGLVSIVIMVTWAKWRPKKLRAVPGPLLAVAVAAIGSAVLGLQIQHVEVPSNLFGSLNIPAFGDFVLLAKPDFLGEVMALATIASAETLLCASAIDRLHDGPRTHYNKELFAQGVGNTLAGLLGALPITGVIVRSAANVDAGAKTRLSSILHGIWLLALILFLPQLLERIPTASLAAILVFTGYNLANPKHAIELYRRSRGEFAVYAVTMVAIVATDLLTGVLVGLAVSVVKLLRTLGHLDIHLTREGDRVDVRLEGAALFIGLPSLARHLETIEPGTRVHVHVGGLSYVDHACLELLRSFQQSHRASGGTVSLEWDALEARAGSRPIIPEPSASEPPAAPAPASTTDRRAQPA